MLALTEVNKSFPITADYEFTKKLMIPNWTKDCAIIIKTDINADHT